MKVFVASGDAQGRLDGTLQKFLLSHFQQVTSQASADVVLVVISFFHDFKFNHRLTEITKPVVVMDFSELEWCYFDEKNETHLFGKNTRDCRWLNPNWYPLCDWVRDCQPVLTLKRELLLRDQSDTVKPIDWPCYLSPQELHSEDEFNTRPIDVFNNFGYSHPARPKLHGDIFRAMATSGIGVISDKEQFHGYFQNPSTKTWATIFAPWYSRVAIEDIIWWQERSRLTTSLFGCGRKCFRHSEIVNSVMAKQADDLAWSFPWTEENCVLLRPNHEFEDLEIATRRSDLYEVYKQGIANVDRYRGHRYVPERLVPLIQSRL